MRNKRVSNIDRRLQEAVIDGGRIISRHCSFYNAQCAVERYLRTGRISNNYKIVRLSEAQKRCKGDKQW